MPTLFFDFDDTLSEQLPFNLQYVRGLGGALAPIYGGEVEEWAAHAADMMVALEADYLMRFRANPLNGYCAWLPGMLARAVEMLFAGMQLPLPDDPGSLARQMRREALLACNTLFPGALDAVRNLHGKGIPLHMASGNDSDHLQTALAAVDLTPYMDRHFGPDLVDCAKEGPEFYQRILAELRLPPQEAVFIDNDPAAIRWAQAVGAQTIQVKLLPYHHVDTVPGVCAVVTHLDQLDAAIAQV